LKTILYILLKLAVTTSVTERFLPHAPHPLLLTPHVFMTDIVIKAENIGKKYTIGHQAQRGGYSSLRDVLMQNALTLWNKTKDLATGKAIIQGDTMEEVWALKDASFVYFSLFTVCF